MRGPHSPPSRLAGDVTGQAVLGLDGQHTPASVRRFSHDAMATVFEVHTVHPDARYAAQAAQAAFDVVDRLEGELSRFRANSDITRINHLAAGEATRVSPSTLECLAVARHMFDVTGGAFDVSIGTGLASLAFDHDTLTVHATTSGVRIDLGGIGKGYAVDAMADVLDEWGIASALVHGGFSSVLALDPPPGADGWLLTMSDPGAASRVLVRRSVRHTALGASGLAKGAHIVDPRTGAPVEGRAAAWVAVARPAPAAGTGDDRDGDRGGDGDRDGQANAGDDRPLADGGVGGVRVAATAVTDALATACMLLDELEIDALCARSPGLEAWILDAPGADLRHYPR